jgi:hypothetical protein
VGLLKHFFDLVPTLWASTGGTLCWGFESLHDVTAISALPEDLSVSLEHGALLDLLLEQSEALLVLALDGRD